jgi:SAM-dependent methyltransferase
VIKFLISVATRFVPRHYLHHVSHFFLLVISPFYWGNTFEDPITGKTYRKLLPYGRLNPRENALSPGSMALERHRLLWIFLQKFKPEFFQNSISLLHIAPEYCFLSRFKKMENLDYTTADLNSPWADIHMDAHEMPFADNKFDVVFCNHVLEHVADDKQVMHELYRVMKTGGWGIFQIPQDITLAKTHGDSSVTDPRERERLYGQSDHVRQYGLDYPEFLREAGFKVEKLDWEKEISQELVERYALPKGEHLYLCSK